MNSLTFNGGSLSASAPSAGLWRRAADLYWTGWTQYAASLNGEADFRPQFPAFSRNVAQFGQAAAEAPARAAAPGADRLIDRAA